MHTRAALTTHLFISGEARLSLCYGTFDYLKVAFLTLSVPDSHTAMLNADLGPFKL
jgi:hypothetical protein